MKNLMKNKKIIALAVLSSLIVVILIIYFSKGSSKTINTPVTTSVTTPVSTPVTEKDKYPDPMHLPPNDRQYYYDNTYYHKDPECKNHDGFIKLYKNHINGLLYDKKQACPVCVPKEEAEENREGRKK